MELRKCESVRILATALAVLAAVSAFAFQPVPDASVKALKITRGKSFSKGLVFVNGKVLLPPYVVERRGTGIRVNEQAVTGEVVAWDEFLKTQPNVKTEKKDVEVVSSKVVVVRPEEPEKSAESEEEVDLDDLFDDETGAEDGEDERKDEKPEKPQASVVRQEVRSTKTVVSYSIDGEFVPNDASKALLARVNAKRTEIDKNLRMGGFVFFGNRHEPFLGNGRMLQEMVKVLPELMKTAANEKDFVVRAQAAGLSYLGGRILKDLYRNHVDYPKLQKYRRRAVAGTELDPALKDLAKPLF